MDKHRRWVRPQGPRPKAVTAACATKSETTANLGIYTARGVENVTAANCWSRRGTRAAGTYATVVSGQSQTPFLHIPYQKPTVGSMPAPKRRAVRRLRSSPSRNLRASESERVNRECEINLNNDLKTCSRTAKQFGRRNSEEPRIFKICEATAMERYSECLNGGGIHAIRTPLYNGRYHRGG